MKNLFMTMAIIAIVGLAGCNKDELAAIERDVNSLQDSLNLAIEQHNILIDSVSTLIEIITNTDTADVNSLKIAQIASLFEAISRQPEAFDKLMNATEMLYFDYTELLPFTDRTIIQRGNSLSIMFDGIARQPEAYHKLDSAATKFLGEFNPFFMSNDIVEGKARGLALYGLFESIARQPEAHSKMDSLASRFLGEYNPSYFSDELIEVSKAYAMEGLNDGIARQPEADSLFNLVCVKYFNLSFIDD